MRSDAAKRPTNHRDEQIEQNEQRRNEAVILEEEQFLQRIREGPERKQQEREPEEKAKGVLHGRSFIAARPAR